MLEELLDAGMKKINFSGGEPFMEPDYLARALHLCHSRGCYTSIISNSSLITEEWLESNHKNLDMLGLSLDCSDDSINKELGRGFGHHVELVRVPEDGFVQSNTKL